MADNGVGDFDVVILGAGSGGYACALRAAHSAADVRETPCQLRPFCFIRRLYSRIRAG